jgi:S1-C subfamily serine protease
VNWVDVLVVAGIAAAAIAGFRLGFVARVLSWIGMLVGIVVALVVLGPLLTEVGPDSAARAVVIAVAVVLLGAFVGQAVGLVVGDRLRPPRDDEGLNRVDALLGLVAGVTGAFLLVWVLLPVVTQRGGPVASQVSASWLAREVEARLPEPPDALQALRSLVGEDRFPDVFADREPSAPLGPPPASSGLSEAIAEVTAASVVKVEGIACRKIQDGTGFAVERDVIVTNAHVVAGETSTEVIRDDGKHLRADVVAFDPDRDVALLEVPGLDREPLSLGAAAVGDVGGVFGHPQGQPLRIAPFEVARLIDATGRNIYGSGLVARDVVESASDLQPGDSGSPMVDPDGRVIGLVFAIARDRAAVAYALATSEVRAVLAGPRAPADTGACVAD